MVIISNSQNAKKWPGHTFLMHDLSVCSSTTLIYPFKSLLRDNRIYFKYPSYYSYHGIIFFILFSEYKNNISKYSLETVLQCCFFYLNEQCKRNTVSYECFTKPFPSNEPLNVILRTMITSITEQWLNVKGINHAIKIFVSS